MSAARTIGAFPFPAGLLLLDDDVDGAVGLVADSLAAGKLPPAWPPRLRAHELAHQGRFDEALAALDPDGPFALYNRYVLAPETVATDAVAASLPEELRPLVDVISFTNGSLERPPVLPAGPGVDPVIAALILAAQATAWLADGQPGEAVELLHRAADSAAPDAPALAAVLRGNAGTLAHEQLGDVETARADLRAALSELADSDLLVARAELHYQLGTIEHEQAAAAELPLQGAMHEYYTALQLITRDDAPYLWASTQMNLSAAYLATPMSEASDTLRMGIAIQALRAALEVFDREHYPEQWATATLNLANALVYTPSVKQGDNVVEAVELYEQVLDARDRNRDPLGRARVLANQGNALAHLGIFDQAKAKLVEARFLFEEQLDHDSVMMVRSILDEIVKRGAAVS